MIHTDALKELQKEIKNKKRSGQSILDFDSFYKSVKEKLKEERKIEIEKRFLKSETSLKNQEIKKEEFLKSKSEEDQERKKDFFI